MSDTQAKAPEKPAARKETVLRRTGSIVPQQSVQGKAQETKLDR